MPNTPGYDHKHTLSCTCYEDATASAGNLQPMPDPYTAAQFEAEMADFRRRYRATIHLGFPPLSKERIKAMYPELDDRRDDAEPRA